MKTYNNGPRKGMMYGGMSRRKPMMYGGMAKKPRKKAQMGGSMTTTQKQQNQQMAGMMPMQPMNMQRMAEGGKTFPDLTGDGKVTKKDILKGRGVELMYGGKAKKRG
tara:strand:- start:1061 stop:1381 length:321 start_codon:yes stop_codon:yes gene_type:complete